MKDLHDQKNKTKDMWSQKNHLEPHQTVMGGELRDDFVTCGIKKVIYLLSLRSSFLSALFMYFVIDLSTLGSGVFHGFISDWTHEDLKKDLIHDATKQKHQTLTFKKLHFLSKCLMSPLDK